MATESLIKAVESYDNYILRNPILGMPNNQLAIKDANEVLNAYLQAAEVAFVTEEDIEYGYGIGKKVRQIVSDYLLNFSECDFRTFEEYAQKNKTYFQILEYYYDMLKLESLYKFDSYCLYIEKNRMRKDRFYEPRRNTLIRITDRLQKMEDDLLDELFVHQPPRTGKLLSDETPVFTRKGWKNHGDLVVGDEVVGSDGKWVKVIAVHPKHHTTHKVIFTNGEEIECHANHEWTVYDRHAQKVKTFETHEMIGKTKDYCVSKTYYRYQLYEFSKQRMIAIKSIVESEHKQGNCITVANKDGLYAVGRTMILTHNSQLMTMFGAWHCAKHSELSNLYATYKESLGGAYLVGVQEIWTDPTYCHMDVFPNMRIVATDAKNHKIDLDRKKKYATLSGKGLESGLNGEYDATGVLIIDDPLEGIQDVLNPEILRRKQIVFDNNLMSRKKEKCKVIYNGTIWSLTDLFSDRVNFLESNPEAKDIRWEILKLPALDENDKSNFEYDYGVGFSTQYYLTTRAKFEDNDDIASWMAQYQQEPIERDGAVFSPDQMKFYNGVLPNEEPYRICAACDVALGGGDFLSMPVAYCYENGDVYVHDVVFDNSEKKITKPQVVEKLINNNCGSAFFESNQGGEGYKDEIDTMLRKNGKKINLTSAYAPTNMRKEQRIWDKAGSIRDMYFRDPSCRDSQYKKFMQNVYSFTMTGARNKKKHDDAPDSLATLAAFIEGNWQAAKVEVMRNPFRGL